MGLNNQFLCHQQVHFRELLFLVARLHSCPRSQGAAGVLGSQAIWHWDPAWRFAAPSFANRQEFSAHQVGSSALMLHIQKPIAAALFNHKKLSLWNCYRSSGRKKDRCISWFWKWNQLVLFSFSWLLAVYSKDQITWPLGSYPRDPGCPCQRMIGVYNLLLSNWIPTRAALRSLLNGIITPICRVK